MGTCPAHGLGSTCVPERVEHPPADSGVQPPFCALRRGRGRARRMRSPKHHLAGDGAEMPAMPGHVRTAGVGNACDLLPRRARGRLCPVHWGAAWAAVAYVWGGGRWTFGPCQQDDGPSTGLLVALQCSTLGSSPPGPQNMAGCGDGCLQRGRSYNEVTRVDLIPQDDVLIRHTEGPREDTERGRRPHAQERGPGRDRPCPRPHLGCPACRTGTHKALFFEPPRSPHCYVSPSTLNRWLVETAAHEKPAPKTLRETISPSPARGTDTGHALAWLSPPSARIPHDESTRQTPSVT